MNQNAEDFSPEEKIKNEIELMKLKLEVEYGAITHTSETHAIPPEIELEWYNHINNYEKLCKEAGYTTVYDLIGSPSYQDYSDLLPEERNAKLQHLLDFMREKGIVLDFLDSCYSSEVLYRFITEELFLEQVCRYNGPSGEEGFRVFCYEEFHPNHDYDLFVATENLLNEVFGEKKWQTEFLKYTHESLIELNHKKLNVEDYSKRIIDFKEQYPSFLFTEKKIETIQFDLEAKKANAKGTIQMNKEWIPFTVLF
jgi:hypothetical protein